MINKIYCLKDIKIGYMQPFTMQNDAVAIRAFANSARANQPNNVNTNSEDIELYCIGEFNDTTGKINGIEPEFMAKAVDFVKIGE
ncbi:MAG: hypothetical protein PUB18_00965 [bacterium]|nr:hypothetical protein [bacterium]